MPRPVHFELHGENPEEAADFYAGVFGWTVDRWGDDEYWLLGTGAEAPGIDGAIAPVADHAQQVVLTIEVDDLDEAVAAVGRHGGSLVMERAPIPGIGFLAQVRDPNGIIIGLMEPDPAAGT